MHLFSGRPDPSWLLSDHAVGRLVGLWALLTPLEGRPPHAPPLGYRGCFAYDPVHGRRWEAYGGAVTLQRPDGRENREDPTRAFERWVLQCAPEGALPENVLDLAGLGDP